MLRIRDWSRCVKGAFTSGLARRHSGLVHRPGHERLSSVIGSAQE